jgi:hypothetical protein
VSPTVAQASRPVSPTASYGKNQLLIVKKVVFLPITLISPLFFLTVNTLFISLLGETGVYRDTGSKGTVGEKKVDVNKILKNLVCYLNTYNILWHEIWLSFVNNCTSY